jgi:hypothetical protein
MRLITCAHLRTRTKKEGRTDNNQTYTHLSPPLAKKRLLWPLARRLKSGRDRRHRTCTQK